jgi:Zn-dependent M28 family amino/carboxypeptidase
MQIREATATPGRLDLIDILASVQESGLRASVEALAFPRHRLAQKRANGRAVEWLAAELGASGLRVSVEGQYRNVVALPAGGVQPRVLVGAHLDSVALSPGADDNASGVAALVACARALSVHGLPVAYVGFNGEEEGLLGSTELAAAPGVLGGVRAAHVLEMLGYASDEPGSQRAPLPLPVGMPTVGNFLGLLSNQRSNRLLDGVMALREAYAPTLPIFGLKAHLGVERWLEVLHRSDHSPLWKAGIPAVMWTDTAEFRNPHYHRPSDTPDTLDYGFLRRVTRLLVAAVARQSEEG